MREMVDVRDASGGRARSVLDSGLLLAHRYYSRKRLNNLLCLGPSLAASRTPSTGSSRGSARRWPARAASSCSISWLRVPRPWNGWRGKPGSRVPKPPSTSSPSAAPRRVGAPRRIPRDLLADRGALEAVDQAVLVGRVQRGEVTLLDVRPVEEYAAGHILGAVSVPLRALEHRLAGLPKRRQIVAYCRGPYCVLAMEAVARLRALGFKALRLEDGIPDWRARGLPVAVGAP